jgi:REP element-mobilizing transposase RayT
MPNTYSQINIQIVFAVKGRHSLISINHREEIQKYITGIVQNRNHKMLSIFCMPDHTHLLIGMKPSSAISDMTRAIKAGSSKFINDQRWIRDRFNWQEGFGAFSYSRSQIGTIIKYISRLEEHHATTAFREEYLGFLKQFEIDYDDRYIFELIE